MSGTEEQHQTERDHKRSGAEQIDSEMRDKAAAEDRAFGEAIEQWKMRGEAKPEPEGPPEQE
jgi:hypothetical protein